MTHYGLVLVKPIHCKDLTHVKDHNVRMNPVLPFYSSGSHRTLNTPRGCLEIYAGIFVYFKMEICTWSRSRMLDILQYIVKP